MDYSNFNSIENYQNNSLANQINSSLSTATPTGTNVNNLGMDPAPTGNALNQPMNG